MTNEAGHPSLVSNPTLNALTAACIYFDLNVDSLFHIFIPGYQDPIFNGKPLGTNSTPLDLSQNIEAYVDLLEDANFEYKLEKERKVIKKYKFKNAA